MGRGGSLRRGPWLNLTHGALKSSGLVDRYAPVWYSGLNVERFLLGVRLQGHRRVIPLPFIHVAKARTSVPRERFTRAPLNR